MGGEEQLDDIISQIVQALQDPQSNSDVGRIISNNFNTGITHKKLEENFTPDVVQRQSAMNPEDQIMENSRKLE